jgi:CRP/FNR family cyclic AMP-dependent transcriptional regulator
MSRLKGQESMFRREPNGEPPLACDLRPYLSAWGAPRTCPRNAVLFLQGSLADRLYYIEQGLIKLTIVDSQGGECIVALRRPGWLLGISAVILFSNYPATATTLTKCTLRSIRREKFWEHLQNNIGLSLQMNRMLCQEIGYHLTRQSHLSRRGDSKRLENLLSDLIIEECGGEELPEPFEIPLRNHEIAEIIGFTVEHTSRLLKKMEDGGLIKRTRSNLVILRPQDLWSRNGNNGNPASHLHSTKNGM